MPSTPSASGFIFAVLALCTLCLLALLLLILLDIRRERGRTRPRAPMSSRPQGIETANPPAAAFCPQGRFIPFP